MLLIDQGIIYNRSISYILSWVKSAPLIFGKAKTAICSPKTKTIGECNIDIPLQRVVGNIIAVKFIGYVIQVNSRRKNTLDVGR